MEYYVGLDVSVKTTAICIVDGTGDVVREAALVTEPETLVAFLRGLGLDMVRVGHEAGPMSAWLHEGLEAAGLPVVCVEARHMKSALSAMVNKTDRNDARGIAQMMRTGWYKRVHVKGQDARRLRLLLTNRRTLIDQRCHVEQVIRGTLKGFGLKVGVVGRRGFEARIMELLAERTDLVGLVEPLLVAHRAIMEQGAVLDRKLREAVREDAVCRRLMTVPGVGPVVAASFRSGVDTAERFGRSRAVGAYFGLTPRKYESGETSRTGRISKCGDGAVRTALYEAANILLTRVKSWCALKAWGLRLARHAGMQKAKVAVARKLAVILHRMWRDGVDFRMRKEVTA
ncbi:MAG: IS110 family transposase [Rhodospirillales bacterium]